MSQMTTDPAPFTTEDFERRMERAAAQAAGEGLTGVLVTPGTYLGPGGAGYVRFALVPTEEECERAAAILEEVL